MPKILKLSPYCYPEQVSSSYISKDLREAYINAGFTIENYVPTPTRGVSEEVREKYKKIKYEEQENGKIIIHRFSMFREGRNPVFRALRYLLVNMIQYYKGSQAKDVDLIMSGSTPPTQGLLCGMVKRKLSKRYGRNVPFIYNLQDIFPDSLVNTGLTHKDSILWKIGRKIENYTYKSADKIIVISENFKNNIMEKGVPENKIAVIPNWADTDGIYPVERNDNILFDRYNLERDKFYISYSGNIGYTQNMDLLLDVAKKIKDELKDVRFVIIGEGAAKADVERRIKEENIYNVILLPFQPYEDIAHVFSLGDVGLIISKPGVGNNSVPSKTWGFMAAKRPILASFDENSELCKTIINTKCGIVSEAGNVHGFINAIRNIVNNRPECNDMGSNGLTYLMTKLNRKVCTDKFVEILCEFGNRKENL